MKPHNFSLRQLQYLIAVADTGRFRRAAELCHVSQPALSAQLAQLESVLGSGSSSETVAASCPLGKAKS